MGYRVLAVGVASGVKDYPKSQSEFKFAFKGFIAFYDPPKENINSVLEKFYKAGIKVKIITGDNSTTTSTIANQIGLRGAKQTITGDALMQLKTHFLTRWFRIQPSSHGCFPMQN